MEEPLRKTLKDESPYVRKTAAICVAKLFDLNPTLCVENGFLETLQEMIGDSNPMVVANSVTALAEINQTAPETKALRVTPATLKKMIMALTECTEWGRVTILTTLAEYKTLDVKESEHICERVAPQFQHVNSSVVLAAVKVVFLHMKNLNMELQNQYLRKMAPPLGMSTNTHFPGVILMRTSNSRYICPRGSICCVKEYRPASSSQARHSQQRTTSFFLQIQRSSIRQITEA
jgi:vesicle coat complex subunit